MTIPSIRVKIEQAIIAGGLYVGTYQFQSDPGQPPPPLVPAYSVGQSPGPGVEVKGIEIVLRLSPKLEKISSFKGTSYIHRWVIHVKSWDDAISVVPYLKAIGKAFRNASSPTLSPSTSEYLEEGTIQVPDYD